MYLESKSITSPVSRHNTDFFPGEILLEQGSGPFNDDSLSTANGLYIVCDGATSLIHDNGNGSRPLLSGGQRAAQITSEVFSQNSGPLADMAKKANDMIRIEMAGAGVDFNKREHLWTTSFAAARFVEDRLEWAQTGDCMIMFINNDGSSRLVTEETGQDIETLSKWKLIGESVSGTIHQVLSDDIASVRRDMNRTYGVLNGEREALDFVKYGSEKLQFVNAILIFSDGFWLPGRFPEAGFDAEGLAELYNSSNLKGVKDYIRSVQESDPRCCEYPRFKMHDDISAIALTRECGTIQEASRKNN